MSYKGWLTSFSVLSVLFILGGIGYGGFYSQSKDSSDLVWMLFLLVIGIALGLLVAFLIYSDIQMEKEAQIRRQIEHKKVSEINQLAQEGRWNFPSEKFYLLCRDAKVTTLDNEFAINKAVVLAKQVIKETAPDIKPENCQKYLSRESLEQFLAEGKKTADKTEAEEVIRQKQPRNANPDPQEETFINRASKLVSLSGCEKRVAMFNNLISDYSARIAALRESEEAFKTLGMLYAGQQKKESDWAIMGGIANGIAGPGAGAAVAIDTMANNAKIREQNAAIRQTSMDIMSGGFALAGDRYKLQEEQQKIWKQRDDAKNKVVLSKPAGEVWNNLRVGKTTVKKNSSGVLAVTVGITIMTPFALDVPDGVNMVVDGTIKGEVWFEQKYVGDVFFPLPLYGIPCNMTAEATLDGMCGRSVEYDGEYTVKIRDEQNLWIMEA